MDISENLKIQILMIDDDEDEFIIIKRLFSKIGDTYTLHWVNNFEKGLEEIIKPDYQICLLDYRLGPHSGIELIQEAEEKACNIPIILLTGQGDHDVDLKAMKAGAADYLDKRILDSGILERAVRYAIERKKSEEKIKFLAYYDQLTYLPNRTLFLDRLQIAFSSAKRHNRLFSILFLDIDNFKTVNDSLGHTMGDKLIKEVAIRLSQCIRKDDTLMRGGFNLVVDTVARMGGDEFTIILSEVQSEENASTVAARIHEFLVPPFQLDKLAINVTVSIGIAVYPLDGEDIETLIKHADLAMYSAKALGKNNFQYYNPTMNVSAQKRLLLEHDLGQALENNEFSLYYQPIINLKTRKIASIEALIRWQHPQKGIISPMDFIPVAEECGLILPIGSVVLNLIGTFYRKFSKLKIPAVNMAINISPRQLCSLNFVQDVKNIFEQFSIPPALITFEITENCIINNVSNAIEMINELKALGISISLDDFGAGYTSFCNIKQIAFDYLKIDRSFIANIPAHAGDSAITASVITIGHSFNLTVIAEGVENQSQLSFIDSLACDLAQGYYFARPLQEGDIIEMLKKE